MRGVFIAVLALVALGLVPTANAGRSDGLVEVVVTLDAPPLVEAIRKSRVLTSRAKAQRLDLRAPTSVDYLASLANTQRALAARITTTIPGSRVTWRYGVLLDGVGVLLPRSDLGRLSATPGVSKVWPNVAYRPLLDRSPQLIGADQMWGAPSFSTAGNGIRIGIVDDGVDQAHPFFNPSGYAMPPGFPKGNTAFTTAKVIVARAFPAPETTWKYAKLPFDPAESEHATHVAGIAAGDFSPGAIPGRGPLSGVAPRAYLGNYKVLTYPTSNFGLNGNAPEIAAGIEAAVKDGMDVINLSLGEAEIEPSRDLVVSAINAAADAGVVPVIAAGNDFDDFGRGSVDSPGSAEKAITAAAVTKQLQIASFSSSGPTPVSLQMKPDVAAPGVDITSSVPPSRGTWASFSGTSMATPHVAGAAALLLQRHPGWTVAQVKSALVLTAKPVPSAAGELPTTREGGGLIQVPAANQPLIFAAPADLSFGLLDVGTSATRTVALTDADGGAGTWTASVSLQGAFPGVSVTAPPSVGVPGSLDVTATAAATAPEADVTGFVVLALGTATRRIPFWFRVASPKLGTEPHASLSRTGTYTGQLRGKKALVSSYRYPADPRGVPGAGGPEQVFRVRLTRPVANFGVVVLSNAAGTRFRPSPRVVSAGDENRLTGEPGLPLVINPYLNSFGASRPVAGAIRPGAGSYDLVFDTAAPVTPSGRGPGRFTFRFWLNDVTPPSVRLSTPTVRAGSVLRLAVADGGSGVDPESLVASIDGQAVDATYASGRATIRLAAAAPGKHRLVLQVSDYQELKNMENVPQILPNTRRFTATFTVR
ncbi:MAG: S8 family peptidase [Verrucomicrobiota bacterium]